MRGFNIAMTKVVNEYIYCCLMLSKLLTKFHIKYFSIYCWKNEFLGIVNLLYYMYSNQLCHIKWGDKHLQVSPYQIIKPTVCICMVLSYGIYTVTMLMNLEWLGEKLNGEYGDYLIGHTMRLCRIWVIILMISWKWMIKKYPYVSKSRQWCLQIYMYIVV